MIQQIDHILIVVPDIEDARLLFKAAGCPLLWNGVWNDPRSAGAVSLFGVSVGPVNLEIIAAEGLSLFGLENGAFGVASVAFDPGDTEETVQSLRKAGFAVPDPLPWQAGDTFISSEGDKEESAVSLPTGGINTQLPDLLPGLPAFLSEYLPPHQHRGRAQPDSPVQFVALTVRQADPAAVVAVYESALGVKGRSEHGGEFLLPLSDTPLRLAPGEGRGNREVVLRTESDLVPVEALSRAVPGLRWKIG